MIKLRHSTWLHQEIACLRTEGADFVICCSYLASESRNMPQFRMEIRFFSKSSPFTMFKYSHTKTLIQLLQTASQFLDSENLGSPVLSAFLLWKDTRWCGCRPGQWRHNYRRGAPGPESNKTRQTHQTMVTTQASNYVYIRIYTPFPQHFVWGGQLFLVECLSLGPGRAGLAWFYSSHHQRMMPSPGLGLLVPACYSQSPPPQQHLDSSFWKLFVCFLEWR